jgi:UDPglucose 6-dehydrogenase
MNIGIIGCGYVGIITSVGLAHLGYKVWGVESNAERLIALQERRLPIYEPRLEGLYHSVTENGNLQFTGSIPEMLKECEVAFICVGTPPKENGEPDLSQIESVLGEVGASLPEGSYRIIVNKSTVPVGSADYVYALIEEYLGDRIHGPNAPSFDVVSNPEFLREGSALQDSFYPDRIVIGTTSSRAKETMRELYKPLIERQFEPVPGLMAPPGKPECIETDPRSAELIKYVANAFLAMKISFINEMASISRSIGADISEVARGIGTDKRIGPAFLQAGVGWGGSCFRKDLLALSHLAWEHSCETRMLESTLFVNEQQRSKIVQRLQAELKLLKGKTIAVLGLSFKPNTDDCRDAPALSIIDRILDLGGRVRAYDPQANMPTIERPTFKRMASAKEALTGADAVLVLTDWEEFIHLDPTEVKPLVKGNLVIDGRNCLSPASWQEAGFQVIYFGK